MSDNDDQPSYCGMPGPWAVASGPAGHFIVAPEQSGAILARFPHPCFLPEATLCAGAPELYAELENARAIIEGEAPQYGAALERIDAVLARACGRQP